MSNDNLFRARSVRRHVRESGVGDNGPAHNADQVAFDNTETDLEATTVQAAIEEVAGLDPTAAAQEYTDNAIAALVGDAPELLDTLGEIAAALDNDEELATTLLNAISEKADADHDHDLADLADVDLTTPPADGDALVWDDEAEAWVAGEVAGGSIDTSGLVQVVEHGSTAGTARPEGALVVYWVGSVQPTNATNSDLWYDTTGDV
jgi:hypothetical protein